MRKVHAHPLRIVSAGVVLLTALGSLAWGGHASGQAIRAGASQQATAAAGIASRLPMTFTRNDGQDSDRAVRYIGQAAGVTVMFTAKGVTLDLAAGPTGTTAAGARPGGEVPLTARRAIEVSLDFRHANSHPEVTGAGRDGTVNYFQGADPAGWRTRIPAFDQVVYHDVWPGIDAAFTARGGVLRYSFTVGRGANPAEIRLAYAGARRLAIGRSGALAISTPAATLDDQAPTAAQPVAGHHVPVAVRYRLLGGTTFGFAVRDRTGTPLTIDPGLVYSTFLGGSQGSSSFSVQSSAAGNLYVFGQTSSADFPTTPGAYQRQPSGGADFFVSELNPEGTGLVYSTFVGGARSEGLASGVLDAHGNVYVTGETNSGDFPTTAGAYRRTPFFGGDQSVVFKLNSTGSRLLYSTYLAPGVIGSGLGNQIGVAADGSVVVIGTTSTDYVPTTRGAFETVYPGGQNVGFATRLNATGSALIYATYVGAPMTTQNSVDGGECAAWGVAVDAEGDAYITGDCQAGFPTTHGAYQASARRGGGLLVKLNPRGTGLDYATYWGNDPGNFIFRPDAVAIDGAGDAYVVADAPQGSIRPTRGAFQSHCTVPGGGTPPPGSYCTALAEFNPAGTGLVYSTYFGGQGEEGYDGPNTLAVDRNGLAYVVGTAQAKDIPTTPGAYSAKPGPFMAPFYLAVFGQGTLRYASYVGGTGADCQILGSCSFVIGGPTISRRVTPGQVYLGGTTNATKFPVTPGAFQGTYPGGFNNAVAARLTLPASG